MPEEAIAMCIGCLNELGVLDSDVPTATDDDFNPLDAVYDVVANLCTPGGWAPVQLVCQLLKTQGRVGAGDVLRAFIAWVDLGVMEVETHGTLVRLLKVARAPAAALMPKIHHRGSSPWRAAGGAL